MFRIIAGYFFVILLTAPIQTTFAQSLSEPYQITGAQWLEIDMERHIKSVTDMWALRLAVRVTVIPEKNTIMVVLTEANGQEPVGDSVKKNYVADIENILKSYLAEYPWAKNIYVKVLFV